MDLNRWGLNIFNVAELSNNRPLSCIMYAIFQVNQLRLQKVCVDEVSVWVLD